jgi:hypothetical protein
LCIINKSGECNKYLPKDNSQKEKFFFGDLHRLSKDAVGFFTETEMVTSHCFEEKENTIKS